MGKVVKIAWGGEWWGRGIGDDGDSRAWNGRWVSRRGIERLNGALMARV
jgi:hypothetical protein